MKRCVQRIPKLLPEGIFERNPIETIQISWSFFGEVLKKKNNLRKKHRKEQEHPYKKIIKKNPDKIP